MDMEIRELSIPVANPEMIDSILHGIMSHVSKIPQVMCLQAIYLLANKEGQTTFALYTSFW
jgi:hypothetical protein